ncbi:hypothetical protein GCM10027596_31760 [Nocardioides korecus]
MTGGRPWVPVRGFAVVLLFQLVMTGMTLYCAFNSEYFWAVVFGALAIWFVRLVVIVGRAAFGGRG